MPLKHLTETVLVVLLAASTIVTGIIVSTLPPIPEGFFPWAGVFVATILYPAFLYPLLKNNRADYAFRILHLAPLAITVGWLLVQIVIIKEPRMMILNTVYTWGWGALGVAVVFVLLAVFCLQVIRRWIPRLTFLVVMLVPFLALAYYSQQHTRWNDTIAGTLWGDRAVQIAQNDGSSSSSAVAVSSRGEKNLASSSVPEEEAWREKLRAVEEAKTHSSVRSSLEGVNVTSMISSSSTSASSEGTRVVVKTTDLTKSGGEMEAMALFFLAAFAVTLHRRARARALGFDMVSA